MLSAIAVLLGAGAAAAQQRTTASYGDWTVICESEPGDAAKRCEVGQELSVANGDGQLRKVAYVAIGRPAADQPMNVAAKLPLGSFLPTNVTIAGPDDKPKLTIPYQHCLADGCVALAPIDKVAVKALRAATAPMTISFDLLQDTGHRTVQLRVSMTGLSDALDALEKQ